MRTLDPTKSKISWIFQWIFFFKKWNAQNSLLCKIHMNPCLGHSVWILAERAMPLFFTWYSLQVAPRSESSTFQSFVFHLFAMWMLFCTLSWIRVDDSLGDLLVGSFIGLGKNYWQIITEVKNGSKNSALVYHFLLIYALKFVRRSEWAVENPRFPSVGAEVNSTSAHRIEPFYRVIFL